MRSSSVCRRRARPAALSSSQFWILGSSRLGAEPGVPERRARHDHSGPSPNCALDGCNAFQTSAAVASPSPSLRKWAALSNTRHETGRPRRPRACATRPWQLVGREDAMRSCVVTARALHSVEQGHRVLADVAEMAGRELADRPKRGQVAPDRRTLEPVVLLHRRVPRDVSRGDGRQARATEVLETPCIARLRGWAQIDHARVPARRRRRVESQTRIRRDALYTGCSPACTPSICSSSSWPQRHARDSAKC